MWGYIIGIALPIFTGMAILATKYPRIYRKAVPALYVCSILIYATVSLWSVAVKIGYTQVLSFIPLEKMDEATKAVDSISISLWISGIIFLVFYLYVLLLSWIADNISKDKPRAK